MSDNNLSIDEILQEAEEILAKIDRKSKETIQIIKSVDKPLEPVDNVKTFIPKKDSKEIKERLSEADGKGKITDKTAIVTKVSDKTRNVSVSDKTAVVPLSGKAKKSFFKHNSKDLDYNTNPPQIIEKSATIKSKSRFDKTSDLQEIPTILAVEELERTRVMLGGEPASSEDNIQLSENDYDSSAQIKMSGFDDEVDQVPTIDEDIAEQLLKQRREDKVNKFRLFAQEEIEGDKKSAAKKILANDYKSRNDRTLAMEQFFKKKTTYQLQLSFTVVLGIVLLMLTMFRNSQYMPAFLSFDFGYYITVIALYAVIMLVNINIILHGFNLRHGINFDFPIAISSLLAMGHTVALLINSDLLLDGGAVYPSAVVFALFLSALGKRSMIVRIIENFEFLTDGNDKYTVEDIVNEVDAAIISRNLLSGEPLLKYSVKTDFPTSFLEISCAYEPADKISRVLGPVMFVLNLILFAVTGIVWGNWNMSFNLLTAGIIISCPVISLFAANHSLIGVSRRLAEKNAMVCGFEGAHTTHSSNALVMEASDLFGARSCDLHGIKTFNGTKIDDAILQTAAVIIKTKSPLAHVFDYVIVGKQSILPDVDGVIYEDKMGTSAWIYQKKILVGNRDLLIRHGVSVPKEEYEKKYTRKGRKALYLAVAGKIAAMFIVSYSADDTLKRSLKKLEKSGITILLKSCDPYINEESIMDIFGLPEGFIRVMTSSNARIFEKYSDMIVEKSPSYTVHNGTAQGFISAVRGSETLVNTESLLSVLVSFGCALGFGVVALLGLVDGMSQINALNVIIFQAIWSIFVIIISKIRISGI